MSVVVHEPPPDGRHRPRTRKYDWQEVRARLTEHPDEWVILLDEVKKPTVPWLRKEGPIILADIREHVEFRLRDADAVSNTGTLYGLYTPGRPAASVAPQAISDEQVLAIRERAAAGESRRSIARDLGVSRTWVGRIVAGKVRAEVGA